MTGGDYSALTPVLPGAVPEQWGLDVRDSVILRFASAAARDSALTGLDAGDSGLTAWLQDVDQLTIWDGASWVPAGPYRVGGTTPRTSDVTMTTTETVADSLTVTCVAGRRYRLTWSGSFHSSVSGDSVDIRARYAAGASVTNTGTLIKACPLSEPAANHNLSGAFTAEITGIAAGQTTFGVFGVRIGGSGTIHLYAGAIYPVTFVIDDVGPA